MATHTLSIKLSIWLRIANSPSHNRSADTKGSSRVNIRRIHRLVGIGFSGDSLRLTIKPTHIPQIWPSIATSSSRLANTGSTRFRTTPCRCSLISIIFPFFGYDAEGVNHLGFLDCRKRSPGLCCFCFAQDSPLLSPYATHTIVGHVPSTLKTWRERHVPDTAYSVPYALHPPSLLRMVNVGRRRRNPAKATSVYQDTGFRRDFRIGVSLVAIYVPENPDRRRVRVRRGARACLVGSRCRDVRLPRETRWS